MTKHEEEIVRHTMKKIADRERKHIDWVNGMLDSLYRDLNMPRPERRNGENGGGRRNGD